MGLKGKIGPSNSQLVRGNLKLNLLPDVYKKSEIDNLLINKQDRLEDGLNTKIDKNKVNVDLSNYLKSSDDLDILSLYLLERG